MCEKCYLLLPSAGFLTPNRLEVAKPGLTEALKQPDLMKKAIKSGPLQ